MALPPINLASPLVAHQPIHLSEPADVSDSWGGSGRGGGGGAGNGGFEGMGFDTSELQHALMRSRQQAGACGGLRRATSAPHSMDSLGWEPAPLSQVQPSTSPMSVRNSSYLPPTGGPMRRVGTSLGLRRSSSFFWTPAAHHDFERAIDCLSSRGGEVTAVNILAEMSHSHSADLKLSDVDKHLRKKMLMHRRVLQQLGTAPDRTGLGSGTACDGAAAASSAASAAASFGAGMAGMAEDGTRGTRMGLRSPMGVRPGGSLGLPPAMAAVAEEPTCLTTNSSTSSDLVGALVTSAGAVLPQAHAPPLQTPAGAGRPPPPSQAQQPSLPHSSPAAAAAHAISESLTQQFQTQRLQHMQLTAAREAMVGNETPAQQA